MMRANDKQVGGNHYSAKVQHWDYVLAALHGCYLEGNASKYVFRWRRKNGIQDLEKAHHYVEKIRELALAGQYPSQHTRGLAFVTGAKKQAAEAFCQMNLDTLGPCEVAILCSLATWEDDADLVFILTEINRLISFAQLRS